MKKNDVFTFTAPNGVEVTGIVVDIVVEHEENGLDESLLDTYLCYAQNRIFYYKHHYGHCQELVSCLDDDEDYPIYKEVDVDKWYIDEIIVDYAILPDYDELLARYNDIEVAQAETQSGM